MVLITSTKYHGAYYFYLMIGFVEDVRKCYSYKKVSAAKELINKQLLRRHNNAAGVMTSEEQ